MKLQVQLHPVAEDQLDGILREMREEGRQLRQVAVVSSLRVERALNLVAVGLLAVAVVLYLTGGSEDNG